MVLQYYSLMMLVVSKNEPDKPTCVASLAGVLKNPANRLLPRATRNRGHAFATLTEPRLEGAVPTEPSKGT